MINSLVGEMELEIGGRKFVLRPSMRVVRQIEEQLGGKSVMAIAMRAFDINGGGMTFSDVCCVLYAGLLGSLEKGEAAPWTREEFDALVWSGGFSNYYRLASSFYGKALKGNPESKKPEAAEAAPIEEQK